MKKSSYEGYSLTRLRRRELIILMHGNRCRMCGYTRCKDALEFHHINPDEKEETLSYMYGHSSFRKILAESIKCILVCATCHKEIHCGFVDPLEVYPYPILSREEAVPLLSAEAKYFIHPVQERECLVCGSLFHPKRSNQRFCSPACGREGISRFQIDKDTLQDMIQTTSYEQIGRSFGVTGRAIKNRCDKLGIVREKRRSISIA